MPSPAAAEEPSNIAPANIRERIIVALDVPTADEARTVIDEIGDGVGAFKIGMQLFTAAGAAFVRELTDQGTKVFLDLKYHDIPNTVAAAGLEAAKMRVWMFNMHASGGSEMMRRTADIVAEYCELTRMRLPIILGVTVLTSSDTQTLAETGISGSVDEQVSRIALLAAEAGLDGVVASAQEVGLVREAVTKPRFFVVTPGIRGRDATLDDQRRVTTIGEAFASGSDFVVIGRPIIAAADRRAAVEKLVEEAAQPE
jgi:orotidine-5'-phosphate decarboxylase